MYIRLRLPHSRKSYFGECPGIIVFLCKGRGGSKSLVLELGGVAPMPPPPIDRGWKKHWQVWKNGEIRVPNHRISRNVKHFVKSYLFFKVHKSEISKSKNNFIIQSFWIKLVNLNTFLNGFCSILKTNIHFEENNEKLTLFSNRKCNNSFQFWLFSWHFF